MDVFTEKKILKINEGLANERIICPYCDRECEESNNHPEKLFLEGWYYAFAQHRCEFCSIGWCSVYRFQRGESLSDLVFSEEILERYFDRQMKKSLVCPICDSEPGVDADQRQRAKYDYDKVYFRFVCNKCGAHWHDRFKYVTSVGCMPSGACSWPWEEIPFLEERRNDKLSYLFNE